MLSIFNLSPTQKPAFLPMVIKLTCLRKKIHPDLTLSFSSPQLGVDAPLPQPPVLGLRLRQARARTHTNTRTHAPCKKLLILPETQRFILTRHSHSSTGSFLSETRTHETAHSYPHRHRHRHCLLFQPPFNLSCSSAWPSVPPLSFLGSSLPRSPALYFLPPFRPPLTPPPFPSALCRIPSLS